MPVRRSCDTTWPVTTAVHRAQARLATRRRREHWRWIAAVVAAIAGGSIGSTSALQVTPAPLELGVVIERENSGGDTDVFIVVVEAGQFAHVRIEQRNADVAVRVIDPDGTETLQRNWLDSKSDPENVSFVARASGPHRIAVTSVERAGRTSRYTIALQALRPPSQADLAQVEAERMAQAAHLLAPTDGAAARAQYEATLPLWRDAGAPEGEALTELAIVATLHASDQPAAAEPRIQRALELAERLGDIRLQADTLTWLTTGQLMQGQARQAIESGTRNLDLARASGALNAAKSALSNLSAAHWMLGNRVEERHFDELALQAARGLDDPQQLANALHNSAVSHFTMGELQPALERSREARDIHRRLGNEREQSAVLNTIGEIYRESNQLRDALAFHTEALAIRRKLGAKDLLAQSLNNLTLVHRSLGDPAAARLAVDESLRLRREVGNRRGEATALLNLGVLLYADLSDREGGRRHLDDALRIAEAGGYETTIVSVLIHLGRLARAAGNDVEARQRFERAYSSAVAARARAEEIDSLREIAALDMRAGDLSGAQKRLDAALSALGDAMDGVIGDRLRAGFFATNAGVFESYVDLLMRRHDEDPAGGHDLTAFSLSEQGRSRELLRLLGGASVDVGSDVAADLVERLQSLQREADALAAKSARSAASSAVGGDRRLNEVLAELQEVRGRISASSARVGSLLDATPRSARDLQSTLLDDDTVLLAYSLGAARSYVWVLTHDRVQSATLPSATEIERSARGLHSALQARNDRPPGESLQRRQQRLARAEAQVAQEAATLSGLLLAPAAEALSTARRVVWVPDGPLAFVPFALLTAPGRSVPLVASHEVVAVPSASAVEAMRRARRGRRPPSRQLAMVADPVYDRSDPRLRSKSSAPAIEPQAPSAPPLRPAWATAAGLRGESGLGRLRYSKEEADSILGLVPPSQRVEAIGLAATRAALGSPAIADARILHVATHGFVNGEYPELSGLALSMVNEDGHPVDGYFRLNHVYNLRLSADLVVLSACQTALGAEVRGEGLVGLTRGLMFAGASQVVASLWSVDDQATAVLMKSFYTAMLGPRHLPPAAALRDAQDTLRRSARWRSPYYWAAFTIQGDWRPN